MGRTRRVRPTPLPVRKIKTGWRLEAGFTPAVAQRGPVNAAMHCLTRWGFHGGGLPPL
jgi:hypothetical protein